MPGDVPAAVSRPLLIPGVSSATAKGRCNTYSTCGCSVLIWATNPASIVPRCSDIVNIINTRRAGTPFGFRPRLHTPSGKITFMRLDQFNVDPDTRRTVGEAALEKAVAGFHPSGECPLCHRPLGTAGRFSLLVDDNTAVVTIRPVHAPCMSSRHRATGTVAISPDTYQSLPAVIPTQRQRRGVVQDLPQPVLLVNHAVDQAILMRPADDPVATPVDELTRMLGDGGWHRAGEPGRIDQPVGTVHVDGLKVTLNASLTGTRWVSEVPVQFIEAMSEWGGGCYAALIHRTSVHEIASSPDPLGVLQACVTNDDLLLGYFARA